jgi:hypothetical protein
LLPRLNCPAGLARTTFSFDLGAGSAVLESNAQIWPR